MLRDPGAAANPEWLCLAARLGECVLRRGDADHVNQSGGTEVALLSNPHETSMGRDLKGGSHIGRANDHWNVGVAVTRTSSVPLVRYDSGLIVYLRGPLEGLNWIITRCMELCFDTKKELDKYISLRGLPSTWMQKCRRNTHRPVSVSIPTPYLSILTKMITVQDPSNCPGWCPLASCTNSSLGVHCPFIARQRTDSCAAIVCMLLSSASLLSLKHLVN